MNDVVTAFDPKMLLRSKAQVGVLSSDVADEGQSVHINSEGEAVSWIAPQAKAVMPDWSGIKSLRRYFGSHIHKAYPAWVYHPTEAPRIVKNAEEAAELGIGYREATMEERGRYGVKSVWDWTAECKWRPDPWPGAMKFDPSKPTHGKNYMPSTPNPVIAQNALLEAVIPQVTAAVIQALKSNGPAAPANIDSAQWAKFQAFLAYEKSQEAMDVIKERLGGDVEVDAADEGEGAATNALAGGSLTPDEERKLWQDEAERKGIKVDGRWSLAKLKSEVEKAA
jgi:hypothetical protein